LEASEAGAAWMTRPDGRATGGRGDGGSGIGRCAEAGRREDDGVSRATSEGGPGAAWWSGIGTSWFGVGAGTKSSQTSVTAMYIH
jgi:hypothetical protein